METIDLLRAIEKSTGYNLAPLFDQYVFRGGHPDFTVNYSWDNESNLVCLKVKQTQAKAEKGKYKDLYALNKKPDFISFDVGNYHLKTLKLEYGVSELKAQLLNDSDPISRIYAAIALGKKGGLETIKTFKKALKDEKFWGVKVEIAKQLGKIKLNQANELLINNIEDKHPKVRRAIVEALTNHKTTATYEALRNVVTQGDASYYVESSAIQTLGKIVTGTLEYVCMYVPYSHSTEPIFKYNIKTETIELLQNILQQKSGWNEVLRSGAINGLSKLQTSPEAADIISKYTKLGTPQALRLTAIRCLGAVAQGQKSDKLTSIFATFESLMEDTFFLTQISLIGGLSQIKDQKAIALLQNLADTTPDGRVKRRAEEAINKVREKLSKDDNLKELQKEIDKLKQENQDLQSRLAKLEID